MKNHIVAVALAIGMLSTAQAAMATERAIEIPFALMKVASISPSDGAGGVAEVTLNGLTAEGLQLKLQCSGGRTSLQVTSQDIVQRLTVGDFYAQGCFSFIRFLVDAGIQSSSVVELRYYGPNKFPGLLINRFAFIPSGGDSPFVLGN